MTGTRPDIILILTDQERAAPPYETEELANWRREALPGARWFDDHGVTFQRHYTGSLACVPSRPTMFTGHYPDVHGVTQTDGLGKMHDDSRMRWLPPGEVPTLGHWFRAAGYDTHYDGKWHLSHADLTDPATGKPLATNDADGMVDPAAVKRYLDADRLDGFGFSGWVGPEPHGPGLANAGYVRDPLLADRVVAWLNDRYARRRAGDEAAGRPFLLVASFVNPHDIVFAPVWLRRTSPLGPCPNEPPDVAASPTDDEDLATKPAAQIAFRASYPSTYGPAPLIERAYQSNAQAYRNLYYRLHVDVDGPLDRVRRAVTDQQTDDGPGAVLVRTADHGELLGAHGGLHQKWFNLYDEATRVPFVVARVGTGGTASRSGRQVEEPTSHVDIVPTLLGAAGIDQAEVQPQLEGSFTEVHLLPGRDLMPVIDGLAEPDRDRAVYLLTRDNMPEGYTGASGMARRMGRVDKPPLPVRIQVPAHVAANHEGLVTRVAEIDAAGGGGHRWKIVRSFDDPATWTEPGVRHLAANGPPGPTYRSEPLPDQWELYDLDDDPIEADNRWLDPTARSVFAHLAARLEAERSAAVPLRNTPWPYATRTPTGGPMAKTAPPPARAVRAALRRLGLHPDDPETIDVDLLGRRALVVATNHGVLDIGKPTGVFASELTVPYYAFLDAGMRVEVASPDGGVIPIDQQSLKPVIRTEADDRFLADDVLRDKVTHSLSVGSLQAEDYDLIYLAGGWGAAFDLGFSAELGRLVTEANAASRVIGGVCHGPLGLLQAVDADGRPLVEGRRVTAVTDKQVTELGITETPQHPETELRRLGAEFESESRFRDPLANHWVVDGNLVTGQNQNAAPMVAREMLQLVVAANESVDATEQER